MLRGIGTEGADASGIVKGSLEGPLEDSLIGAQGIGFSKDLSVPFKLIGAEGALFNQLRGVLHESVRKAVPKTPFEARI